MSQFRLLETLKSFICVRCNLAFASFDLYRCHRRQHVKLFSQWRNGGTCRTCKPPSTENSRQTKKDRHRKRPNSISVSKLKSLEEKARRSSRLLKVKLRKVAIRGDLAVPNGSLGDDDEIVSVPFDSLLEKVSRNKQRHKHQNGNVNVQSKILKVRIQGSKKSNGLKTKGKVTKKKVITRPRISDDQLVSDYTPNGKDFEIVDIRFDDKKIDMTGIEITGPVERTPDGRYKCRVCEKNFASSSGRKIHEDTHDRSKRVRCNICLKDFARPGVLKLHMKKHTNLDKYKCKVCPKEFNQRIQLQLHTKMHTGERDFQCKYCKKQFTRKCAWINHEVGVHQASLPEGHGTNTRILKCKHCSKIFTSNAVLVVHERSHVGEKPYKCETCGKGFNHKSNLTEHARIHSAVKPYYCDLCGGRFRFHSNLTTHLKMHLDVKKFECQICGHSFIQKGGLETHLPTHSGEQPYHCPHCNVGARHVKTMKDHIKLHHSKEKKVKIIPTKNLECSECNRIFSHQSALAQHMNIHTDKFMCQTCNYRFENESKLEIHLVSIDHIKITKKPKSDRYHHCKVCKAIFVKPDKFRKHMTIHPDPFKCYICDVNFSTEDKLKAHKKSFAHKEKRNSTVDLPPNLRHQCSTCNKTFPTMAKYAAHMHTHTDKFKCYICQIRFPSEWYLNRHKEKKKHVQTANPNADMPHACESCDRVYSTASELEKHVVCHSDKYKCVACDVGFPNKSKLARHEQSQGHIKRSGQSESEMGNGESIEVPVTVI